MRVATARRENDRVEDETRDQPVVGADAPTGSKNPGGSSTATATAGAPEPARSPKTQTWSTTLYGRRYELDVTPGLRSRLVARVDGEQVHDKTGSDDRRTIRLGADQRLVVRLSAAGAVKRATVHDGAAELDLDAPAGTRAARLQEFGRTHPTLFALRHLAVQGGVVLVAVLGLGALFSRLVEPVVRWVAERVPDVDLPDIPWPDVDLPDIPVPRIDLSGLPWPTPPAWLLALFDLLDRHEWILQPLVVGLVLALYEMRRQRRQRAQREAARAAADAVATAGSDSDDPPTAAGVDGSAAADPDGPRRRR